MKAIGSYIIITPEKEVAKKTKGGLLLNHQSREDLRYKKAIIENIGDEVKGVKQGGIFGICLEVLGVALPVFAPK